MEVSSGMEIFILYSYDYTDIELQCNSEYIKISNLKLTDGSFRKIILHLPELIANVFCFIQEKNSLLLKNFFQSTLMQRRTKILDK